MPIFVRPVREQLEHDRLIRFLQTKYKRKFDVAVNLGEEQLAPLKLGAHTFFPDLLLTEGKRLAGVIEIETGESVNNLEAMAQWVHFSRARVPFHLYVPVASYDIARRLCEANHVRPAELWTYRAVLDAFDLVRVSSDPGAVAPPVSAPARPSPKPEAKPAPKPAAKPAARPARKPAAKPAAKKPVPKRPSRPVKPAKPVKKVRPKAARKAAARPKPKPARKSGKR